MAASDAREWLDNSIVKGVHPERLIVEEVAVCRPK